MAISGSGPADRIALIVDVLAPGARAVATDEVVGFADLIILAVPMHRFRELPRDLFDGKILVDAMNFWEEIDGVDEELATAQMGTSVVVQQRFTSARVVKSSITWATTNSRRTGVRVARRAASHSPRPAMTALRLQP